MSECAWVETDEGGWQMYMYKQVGHLEASAQSTSHNPFLPCPDFRKIHTSQTRLVVSLLVRFYCHMWVQCSRTYQEGCCVCFQNLKSFLSFMTCHHVAWQDRKTTGSQGLIKHLCGPSQYPTLHSLGLEQLQNLFPARTLLSLVLFLPDPSLGVWGLLMVCCCSCFSPGSFFSPRTSHSNILSASMLPYEYDNLTEHFTWLFFSG